ncbi:HD domain-containing phosphohydrolase [Deinococcus sp. JMULE3]|uniref:HD domain-containing phosphohydrolase n=1 Tax=Deinococcus sp. JMULE3 TaxID=2518341 RepID=UPI001575AA98|nr:HD domain-containing phosphohydrolase [Deinococcus sp. JMULE3]NTY00491.1 HD domain-containing protein [Deinococcus sp. JMULE3]
MDLAALPSDLTLHLTQVGLTASNLSAALRPVLDTLTSHAGARTATYYQRRDHTGRAGPPGPSYPARVCQGPAPLPTLPTDLTRALQRHADLLEWPPDGHRPPLLAAPIHDRDGTLLGALLITHDTPDWSASHRTLLRTLAGLVTLVAARLHAEERERDAHEHALRALSLALEARDHDLRGHTDRVTQLALLVGQAMHLPPDSLGALRWGAYLHDIGKLTLPDDVLHHPGPLTPAMRDRMHQHVQEGLNLARQLPFVPPEALDVIAAHHERWDGSGYPRGRSGTAIPLTARIFAACDVFDALTSPRAYKHAWTPGDALHFVQQGSGTHFDPQVVQALTQVLGHHAA